MYQRYSRVNEVTMPVSQTRRNLFKNILILVLVVLLGVSVALGLPAVRRQASTRSLLIQRMQNEIARADSLTQSLSRNAGASSAATLAQIRSGVYTIQMLNDVSVGIEGTSGLLIPEDRMTSLIQYIDNYLQFLTTGMDTGEYQTNLQNSLDELQLMINNLT